MKATDVAKLLAPSLVELNNQTLSDLIAIVEVLIGECESERDDEVATWLRFFLTGLLKETF